MSNFIFLFLFNDVMFLHNIFVIQLFFVLIFPLCTTFYWLLPLLFQVGWLILTGFSDSFHNELRISVIDVIGFICVHFLLRLCVFMNEILLSILPVTFLVHQMILMDLLSVLRINTSLFCFLGLII